ncbi:hypothetical protein SSS_10709 [Sarcoptes scabiei]|nr:hypothetical protein SSS_10709 [Sarcoptes scabiei]KPM11970.1 DNA topoisomerase 3-alpha [Sarcoptes scabiei]
MARVLNVAEKNDVAKNVANILSRGSSKRREGYSVYNKVYDFRIEVPALNGHCDMIMTSVCGHLLNYDFIAQYSKWNSCDPKILFTAPITSVCLEMSQKIKRTLQREIRRCAALIIWTDCDREGENIGFEIIKVCQEVNPNFRILRAHFSEITSHAIYRALNSLTEPDKRISDAVDVRQQLDLRIGAAFTRFQTIELQKLRPNSNSEKSIISYGSCQFPTLGFVVERWKARESFVPQPFWFIEVTVTKDGIKCTFNWHRQRLFNERACFSILARITEPERIEAKVIKVNHQRRLKYRPVAMDTVTLERLASSKLRINAKRAMTIAEKLYTSGFISYPRTETNKFPPEIKLNDLVSAQLDNPQWGSFAQRILSNGGATPRNGKKTDQAHPPIHPTKAAKNLKQDEKLIYELITRHFLACCDKDATGQEESIEIKIDEEIFKLKGLRIEERNYLEVYPYEKWFNKLIPKFQQDEVFVPDAIMMNEGKTTAPELLTEAQLIALMEKNGIGTDATHAEHIEKIKERKYISETETRHLKPEGLGIGLVEGYDEIGYQMSKPFLRAALEKELQQICDGKKNADQVLQNQLNEYKKVFEESCRNKTKLFGKIIAHI